MSSREEKIRGLTKKEKVVVLAKEDPFLKVEEIAELVETTSHYVRTVLSEADLSLTQLRKEYARQNEVINNSRQCDLLEEIIDFSSLNLTLEMESEAALLKDSPYYKEFNSEEGVSIESTKVFSMGVSPLLVSTYFIKIKEVKSLSQLRSEGEWTFSDIRIGAESPSEKVKKLLQLEKGPLVLTLYQKILIKRKIIGVEKIYFSPRGLDLSIKGRKIKVQKKK